MEAEPLVLDVSERDFEQEVRVASRTRPVVVDFWAEWCGPCKTLGPVLEGLAREAAGGFRLCKVDTEREPRLASLFQIQSIPFVVGFSGGRPVDAFMGALPEPEVRAFLERLGVVFGAGGEDEAAGDDDGPLTRAARALAPGAGTDPAAAWAELEGIEEDDDDHRTAARLLEARPFFDAEVAGAGPAAEALRRARAAWRSGDPDGAMEALLASVTEDPGFADALARRALVAPMQLQKPTGPSRHAAVRRRLAAPRTRASAPGQILHWTGPSPTRRWDRRPGTGKLRARVSCGPPSSPSPLPRRELPGGSLMAQTQAGPTFSRHPSSTTTNGGTGCGTHAND
ncbi:MAG: thioredoxin domain-containing protein [Planctomycetota bacterium]